MLEHATNVPYPIIDGAALLRKVYGSHRNCKDLMSAPTMQVSLGNQ